MIENCLFVEENGASVDGSVERSLRESVPICWVASEGVPLAVMISEHVNAHRFRSLEVYAALRAPLSTQTFTLREQNSSNEFIGQANQ